MAEGFKNAETIWDARVGFNLRTYPVGAQATAGFGYNFLLWDRTTNLKDSWKYGYLRLGANLATSAVVNRAGWEFQVFPISILGVSAGMDWGVRNFTPKWLDCQRFECNGPIDRKFVKGQLFAGYKGFVFAGIVRYEEVKSRAQVYKLFFDEQTLIVGQPNGERVLTWNPALLYTLNETWKVGATSLYTRALDQNDFSHLFGAVGTYTHESRFNVVGGVGLNRSPVVHTGWAAFALVSYYLQPSLSIAETPLRQK